MGRDGVSSVSQNLSEATTAAPPDIPDFDLIQPIGSGAFGKVWLAKTTLTGDLRAVKILRKDPAGTTSAAEIEGLRQYWRASEDQPHLLQIRHVGETPDCCYVVMELADRLPPEPGAPPEMYQPKTLAAEMRKRGRFPARDALEIARRILLGLTALHDKEKFHRDIKPSNILYVGDVIKVADPGLVTQMGTQRSRPGTIGYMPPDDRPDQKWDLFSVGRLLYAMFTGFPAAYGGKELPPLDPPRWTDLFDKSRRAEQRAIRTLIRVMNKATDPDPAKTFATSREMLREMDRLLAGRVREKPIRLAGIAVATLVVLGAAYYVAGGRFAPTRPR